MAIELSAIIACKNEARDIGKCLDAIAKQTLAAGKYEVIFVDGGSTDGTIGIIGKYRKRIRNLRLIKETGRIKSAANARNLGAQVAKGGILAFFDADVIADKGYFGEILSAFSSKIDAASTNAKSFPTKSTWAILREHETLASNYLFQKGRADQFPNIMRKGLFEKVGGYDLNFRYGEDLRMLEKLKMMKAKIIHLDDGVVYHKDPDSFPEIAAQAHFWGKGFCRLLLSDPIRHMPRLCMVLARALLLPLMLIYLSIPDPALFWLVLIMLLITLADGLVVMYRSMRMGGKLKYALMLVPFRMLRSFYFLQGFMFAAFSLQ
ncbi:MAG: glycosyltransferase [Candidatus Micrarchaeota archaeon]